MKIVYDTKISGQNIQRLDSLTMDNVELLNNNDVYTLYDLCQTSQKELKELGFENNQINKINIDLQLLGLRLRNSL